MYALFLTILISISIDCPIVVQLALDMDIKYTNTEYFPQYEKDCCLGVGVICENERVVELHWGFTSNYVSARYPTMQFPSNLRVLNLANSVKSMVIESLPDSLKILDMTDARYIILRLYTLPNLIYISLCVRTTNPNWNLPQFPNSLEYINLGDLYDYRYLPKDTSHLKELYAAIVLSTSTFPNIPDTIEILELPFGDFKSIRTLSFNQNNLIGNLTISSPNITSLSLNRNSFDNLFIDYPERIQTCDLAENYFDISNNNVLSKMTACVYKFKNTRSQDCDNLNLFAKQLNMHLTNPDYYNYLFSLSNCCEDKIHPIKCNGNRIVLIDFSYSYLNGTLNASLLPNTLQSFTIIGNKLQGSFPDFTNLTDLRFLDLSLNKFSGSIMNMLPNSIQAFSAANNELNGTIPNLKSITNLDLHGNYFETIENNWSKTILENIDISNNQIEGLIDLSSYTSQSSYTFRVQYNFIDFIVTNSIFTNTFCDVTMNNLNLTALSNFQNCNYELQRYTKQPYINSCSYFLQMVHKMEIINSDGESNCCKPTLRSVYCYRQNIIELDIYSINFKGAKTFNGYAFSADDLPPSLSQLMISNEFNQTALLPKYIPSHIVDLEITNSNIGGYLPQFAEGLETLRLRNLTLQGALPLLPSTLQVLEATYCGLSGVIPPLPPNLQELYLNGNQFSGPLPVFPASLQVVVLGDKINEGNTFSGSLNLWRPSTIFLGSTNISQVQINDTSSLTKCDLSFNPLSNSTLLSNYSMCYQFYLTAKSLLLQNVETSSIESTLWQQSSTFIFI
eukprot:NODE_519_length_6551_cov_0.408246.p1 type:complete len:790 gc:universal NODE_519_length_6551_cov_0.408246:4603-2234(-)